MGKTFLKPSIVILGGARRPVAHMKSTYGMPTASETTVIVHGIGKTFWQRLFVRLYITFSENHVAKQSPIFRVCTQDIGTVTPMGSVHTASGSSLSHSSTSFEDSGGGGSGVAAASENCSARAGPKRAGVRERTGAAGRARCSRDGPARSATDERAATARRRSTRFEALRIMMGRRR